MKITLNPIKEVFITNFIKLDIQNMAKVKAVNELPISWCDGYLVNFYEEDKEFLLKSKYKGILFLEDFIYAECKEKVSQVKWNGYNVEVLDCSTYSLYKELVKAIPKLEAENQ